MLLVRRRQGRQCRRRVGQACNVKEGVKEEGERRLTDVLTMVYEVLLYGWEYLRAVRPTLA